MLKEDNILKPVVNFVPVSTSLPDLPKSVWNDLSRDQKLLYQHVKFIKKGIIDNGLSEEDKRLASQSVGPVDHARWLTLALRALVLYERDPDPCEGLITLVKFICQVYAVMWFVIKGKSRFTEGPHHLFHLTKLISEQPVEIQGKISQQEFITLK